MKLTRCLRCNGSIDLHKDCKVERINRQLVNVKRKGKEVFIIPLGTELKGYQHINGECYA